MGGLEAIIYGFPQPAHAPDWAALPHVRNDAGRFMEVDVDLRRRWEWTDVLAELDGLVALRLPAIAALPDDPEATMIGPLGQPRPLMPMLPIRAFDVWQHEQDLLHALDRPGTLTTPGAEIAVRQIRSALPYVIGKGRDCAPGTTVRWTITGEQAQDFVIEVNPEGRAAEVPSHAPTSNPTVSITCDTETFTLLGAGRRALNELLVKFEGDAELGARLLTAGAVTP